MLRHPYNSGARLERLGRGESLVCDCIYASYRAQRLQFPEIEPERWEKLFAKFGDDSVRLMEAKFQAELQSGGQA